jgi:hypothetical protein
MNGTRRTYCQEFDRIQASPFGKFIAQRAPELEAL